MASNPACGTQAAFRQRSPPRDLRWHRKGKVPGPPPAGPFLIPQDPAGCLGALQDGDSKGASHTGVS